MLSSTKCTGFDGIPRLKAIVWNVLHVPQKIAQAVNGLELFQPFSIPLILPAFCFKSSLLMFHLNVLGVFRIRHGC